MPIPHPDNPATMTATKSSASNNRGPLAIIVLSLLAVLTLVGCNGSSASVQKDAGDQRTTTASESDAAVQVERTDVRGEVDASGDALAPIGEQEPSAGVDGSGDDDGPGAVPKDDGAREPDDYTTYVGFEFNLASLPVASATLTVTCPSYGGAVTREMSVEPDAGIASVRVRFPNEVCQISAQAFDDEGQVLCQSGVADVEPGTREVNETWDCTYPPPGDVVIDAGAGVIVTYRDPDAGVPVGEHPLIAFPSIAPADPVAGGPFRVSALVGDDRPGVGASIEADGANAECVAIQGPPNFETECVANAGEVTLRIIAVDSDGLRTIVVMRIIVVEPTPPTSAPASFRIEVEDALLARSDVRELAAYMDGNYSFDLRRAEWGETTDDNGDPVRVLSYHHDGADGNSASFMVVFSMAGPPVPFIFENRVDGFFMVTVDEHGVVQRDREEP